eukprot:4291343-Pleurochrysis_carterae.AAC.2
MIVSACPRRGQRSNKKYNGRSTDMCSQLSRLWHLFVHAAHARTVIQATRPCVRGPPESLSSAHFHAQTASQRRKEHLHKPTCGRHQILPGMYCMAQRVNVDAASIINGECAPCRPQLTRAVWVACDVSGEC